MNARLDTAAAAAAPSDHGSSPVSDDTPLTRVTLAHLPRRLAVSLRFGHPVRELALDRTRSVVAFLPGARFARLLWQVTDIGAAHWQLLVLQACTLYEPVQRIAGVDPGAGVLLRAEGRREVCAALPKLDAIEARGIDLAEVAPAYWRTLAGRLAARHPLPDYTAAQHALWRQGKVPR